MSRLAKALFLYKMIIYEYLSSTIGTAVW